jgi:TetR/AcrR family transcriptional repressor of nem operon
MTKAERTRQFIIEQSAPLFNTKGVAGTAMSDIMEATRMAKGGLYGHFESKDELSHAVVDYCLTSIGEKLTNAINQQKTAKGKLFAFIDFYSNPLNPPLKGGCPMVNFGMEADDTSSVIKNKIKDGMEWSEKRLITIINDGITNGEIKADVNAKDLSIKIFAMLEGGTMITRVMNDPGQISAIVRMLKTEIEEQII